MATNFPTSLDALTNPTGSSSLTSPDHAGQHADINDAVEALEAKVGVNGSAVTASLDYKIANIPATSITSGTLNNARLPAAATNITSVGTLGSLTVTGDVTVDTNTLKVNSTTNRVGIGTTTPATTLDVVGTATVRTAAIQDGIALAGRAGGINAYEVTLTPTTLSNTRTITLPDASGTVALTSNQGFVPTGVINMWGTTTAPTNWLLCDGTAVSRTTYAALFAVIGTTYGVGNGSSTFNLPNLKGRVPVGRDTSDASYSTMGGIGGAKTHTLTSNEMPIHTHTQNSHNHTQNSHNHTQNSHNHTQNSHNHTQNAHNHGGSVGTGEILHRDGAYNTGYNSWVGNAYLAITWNGGTASSTASNQATTATNLATTPTNIATTPTNIATTATNQNAGSGNAHNNLQPYIILNYIIKA